MKKIFLLILLPLILFSNAVFAQEIEPTNVSELLMIHNPSCPYCRAFLNEVGPTYSETKQGKALPLHILDVSQSDNTTWLRKEIKAKNIKGILGTPTFIIINNNMEVGRFVGYAGKEWFFDRLDESVKKSVQHESN